MLSALLGLAGALIYGASDFFGGIAARGMSAVRVTVINSVAGFTLLAVTSFVLPLRWSEGAVISGILSGIAGAAALGLLSSVGSCSQLSSRMSRLPRLTTWSSP